MAQKIVTIYTDDLTGEESPEVHTYEFSLDGIRYEIDLAPDGRDKLLEALGPFVGAGRKQGRTSGRPPKGTKRSVPSEDPAAIRTWAKENGYAVNDRGRVPANILDAYNKAR
ncbi:Lsr2 family protein [Streptomyces xiamenensis]|uniref:histone-like nucleoid-structuring protein Lsr2 n=1 Tax=Streptomyces xiamenensis TaxID=408015 RepID=UPI0036789E61